MIDLDVETIRKKSAIERFSGYVNKIGLSEWRKKNAAAAKKYYERNKKEIAERRRRIRAERKTQHADVDDVVRH